MDNAGTYRAVSSEGYPGDNVSPVLPHAVTTIVSIACAPAAYPRCPIAARGGAAWQTFCEWRPQCAATLPILLWSMSWSPAPASRLLSGDFIVSDREEAEGCTWQSRNRDGEVRGVHKKLAPGQWKEGPTLAKACAIPVVFRDELSGQSGTTLNVDVNAALAANTRSHNGGEDGLYEMKERQ